MPNAFRNEPALPRDACGLAWLLTCISCLMSVVAGCDRSGTSEVRPIQQRLAYLGSVYRLYPTENDGRLPRNLEDFKTYVEKRVSPQQLAGLGVESADELFVSQRDGQPFALAIYTKLPELKPGDPGPVVLYETKGEVGRRAVAHFGGVTSIVDERQLPQLLPAAAARAR